MIDRILSAYRNLPIRVWQQFILVLVLALYIYLDAWVAIWTDMAYEGSKPWVMGANYLGSWSVWILLSPLVIRIIDLVFGRAHAFSPYRWLRLIGLVILCIVLHRFFAQLIFMQVFSLAGMPQETPLWSLTMLGYMAVRLFSSIIMLVIVGAFLFGMQYYRWYLDKEKELANARLNALVMQLQPHFLFNTLNSISSLVDLDTKRSQKMLAQLGFLLRKMLDESTAQASLVPLHEEITFLRNYLDIEQVRFQDRLTIRYDIMKEAEPALVPYMIVQPLVENAIKHGVAPLTDNGLLTLKAESLPNGIEQRLIITVIDNGPGLPDTGSVRPGAVGLANVQARLTQRYGQEASLTLRSGPDGKGLEAELNLPYQVRIQSEKR